LPQMRQRHSLKVRANEQPLLPSQGVWASCPLFMWLGHLAPGRLWSVPLQVLKQPRIRQFRSGFLCLHVFRLLQNRNAEPQSARRWTRIF
jgi:hypothetical protein